MLQVLEIPFQQMSDNWLDGIDSICYTPFLELHPHSR